MEKEDLDKLVFNYLTNKSLTPEESIIVQSYLDKYDNRSILLNHIRDEKWLLENITEFSDQESQKVNWDRVKSLLEQGKSVRIIGIRWRKYAAAIIVLLALSIAYLFVRPIKSASSQQNLSVIQDIPAPTGSKAVLTLSNGSKIILDSMHQSSLGKQGNAIITKQSDGEIIYAKVANENNLDVTYNTLSTGKGGQTEVLLADGSKVWLNAASSIKYPTSFNGNERRVEIEGEAYFEISHNKRMPFIVQIPGTAIKVLGTHFNVMAYEDEATSRTTLLEGSVKITKADEVVYLKPGQQGQVHEGERIELFKDVDTSEVMAWKNGEFQFNIESLESVMKQLERWYDIDVFYEGEKPAIRLSGSISRHVNLSNVLKLLELNGVHFRLEGRKITILK